MNAPASPCVGACGLDDAGLCRGCARTGEEIAAWRTMGDAERRRVLADLPRRAGHGVEAANGGQG